MPFVEIFAAPREVPARRTLAQAMTHAICEAFAVDPRTVTLYFVDVPASAYAHAGHYGDEAGAPRVFCKVHAYRRDDEARRRVAAMTTPLLASYGAVAMSEVAVYFFDRARNEVAHAGLLASDVESV